MIKRRVLAVLGIALAATLAVGGYAIGASSRPPVDTACVTSHNVLSHIFPRRVSCPKGQHAVRWNQGGPAGARGQAGPSTAGPKGLDLITVTATGEGSAMAICPASHPFVVGGGGDANPLRVSVRAVISPPPPGPTPTPPPSSPPPSPTPTPSAGVNSSSTARTKFGWSVSNGSSVNGVLAEAICSK